ncbi:MAG: Cna B-type domain-containing protein [Candidatus Onthomonas sp.]
MENQSLLRAEEYTRQHKRRKVWQKIVGCLACVVVFVTTYMLILPAITMEETAYCGYEAHAHGPECYERQLVCGYDETETVEAPEPVAEGHTHGAECYSQEQVLVCDQEESPGHIHDESCVQTEEILICTETDENHEHTPECYEVTETYLCGQTEGEGGHTHGPECYETVDVLICDQPEESGETTEEESTEETEVVHTHTEACYEDVLICEKEEHEHDLSCYSNPEADVESREVWERSVSDVELTGVWADDVIAIAKSQLGYEESTQNYIVTEEGEVKGYTRYGAWYGDPYGDWCAMFVSFCLNYAQVEGMPLESGCQRWIETLSQPEYGLYQPADSDTPIPGDLIFFDWGNDGKADHVGIVAELTLDEANTPTQIKTIEGNSSNQVRYVTYDSGDSSILGYSRLPEQNLELSELTAQTMELAEQTLTAAIYEDGSYAQVSQEETVITVTGLLPLDAEVKAFPVTVETEEQLLCAYDIAILLPDGTLYEPAEGEVMNVSIQRADLGVLEEPLRPEVYYQPEEGEPERMESQVTPEGVTFDTDHFSVYVVLAINETQVSTAAALKTAIENGNSSIQLAAAFTVSESLSIPANANITLDLNGHTLTASGTDALFQIPTGAVLTIIDSQQKNESVEATSGSLAGNTASLSDNTLTYYVTTTRVTNSATGATQETLEKHTVSIAGSIMGGAQPVFQVTGGTLNLQSGMIRGGTGRAVVQTGGTTNLSGGYICGFTQSSGSTDNTSFGGAIRASGGTLSLAGSVLAGNTAHNGGAIYATGSAQISITGGVISGNTSNRTTSGWNDHSESGAYRCGGGGIYADGNAEISMSGGYITNNSATHDGYFDGGGGVCLSGTSSMALSGGYVTGNQAQGGGGIRTDFGKETTFVMTGGFVSANVATHAEGGGIAIDRNGVGTVTGGYITNNKIPNTGHWGGGGLFCADGSTLNLKNTLITENTCGGFGAGVAGCPTGNLYLYVTQGCAIYDNRDTVDGDSPHFTSDGVKQIDKEICTEVFQSNGHADYFCALNSTVTGTMLGNHAANWQGSADYQPVIADAEDVLSATRVMGLQAHPTADAKSAAQAAAKVYINGNYSYTHGGGIMCNGNLVIGVPVDVEVPARVELQATKKLVDGSGNAQSLEDNDFSFKVTMTEPDGTVIASGTCDSSGKITFDHQLTFKQAGTFVYYVYEEVDEENLSVEYDSTLYRLTVTVTKDSGVAWYGDTTKYTYSVTSVKVESSTDGETWKQVSQSSESQSGIISLPLTSETTFTNHLIEPTKVTVQKKWEGGSGVDSVTVILKKDGEEFERQTLNAGNGWTYTWDNLETGHSYTVEEVPVDGYTASYEISTSTDDSGSTSLGQGSWWVPATELTAGQQYLIVSPDGTKALYIASGNEGQG